MTSGGRRPINEWSKKALRLRKRRLLLKIKEGITYDPNLARKKRLVKIKEGHFRY